MLAPRTVPTPLLIVSLAVFWISTLSGCSITQLQHEDLEKPVHHQSGVVNVEPRATGFSGGRVGWGRITLFSIPVVPIHINSDEASDLMSVVRDALTTAGYTPTLTDSPQITPVLKAHVDRVRFNNYTWLVPLVPTWGRINVTLRLESSGGEVLWERPFEGKGTSFDFTDGYNKASIKSVTRLANSMVEAFTTQDFGEALAGGD